MAKEDAWMKKRSHVLCTPCTYPSKLIHVANFAAVSTWPWLFGSPNWSKNVLRISQPWPFFRRQSLRGPGGQYISSYPLRPIHFKDQSPFRFPVEPVSDTLHSFTSLGVTCYIEKKNSTYILCVQKPVPWTRIELAIFRLHWRRSVNKLPWTELSNTTYMIEHPVLRDHSLPNKQKVTDLVSVRRVDFWARNVWVNPALREIGLPV